ncbi:MAG: response regulator [Gammaproteobacteria bacterium]|nr:response regulator [Gammaproteobacteria bacterium]MDE2252177.1 response regulator [Gammaproteobacteria bacterium]
MADILVIDDEPDVRDSMESVLRRAGHAVRTAANALDGIALCRAAPPDLMITDIVMPKGHGFEAITHVRADYPAVRIIAISGGGNFQAAQYRPEAVTTTAYLAAAGRLGVDAVLPKPFDHVELLAAVARVLDTPRQGRPN